MGQDSEVTVTATAATALPVISDDEPANSRPQTSSGSQWVAVDEMTLNFGLETEGLQPHERAGLGRSVCKIIMNRK